MYFQRSPVIPRCVNPIARKRGPSCFILESKGVRKSLDPRFRGDSGKNQAIPSKFNTLWGLPVFALGVHARQFGDGAAAVGAACGADGEAAAAAPLEGGAPDAAVSESSAAGCAV